MIFLHYNLSVPKYFDGSGINAIVLSSPPRTDVLIIAFIYEFILSMQLFSVLHRVYIGETLLQPIRVNIYSMIGGGNIGDYPIFIYLMPICVSFLLLLNSPCFMLAFAVGGPILNFFPN